MSDQKAPAHVALEEALSALVPAVDAAAALSPEAGMAHLNTDVPFDGAQVGAILDLCKQGLADGWLTPRAAGSKIQFGRLAKDLGGYAVDAVVMDNAAGMGHTHTRGEFNMCFALEGEPRFDGHPPGWVVFGHESHHIPTVTGGKMLFLYFTPGGEVVWDS
jgi:hypothetical protein